MAIRAIYHTSLKISVDELSIGASATAARLRKPRPRGPRLRGGHRHRHAISGDLPPDLSGALDTKIYLKNQQPDHKKAVVRALCGANSGPEAANLHGVLERHTQFEGYRRGKPSVGPNRRLACALGAARRTSEFAILLEDSLPNPRREPRGKSATPRSKHAATRVAMANLSRMFEYVIFR